MMSCAEWLQGPHMCRRAAVVMCRMANCQIHLNVVANEVQYLDLLLLMVYSLEVGLVVHVVGWLVGGGEEATWGITFKTNMNLSVN